MSIWSMHKDSDGVPMFGSGHLSSRGWIPAWHLIPVILDEYVDH